MAATADLACHPDRLIKSKCVCVYGYVCKLLQRCIKSQDAGDLTQPGYYDICRDHVLRPFAPLVLLWPSGDGKSSGFYLLVSNLELLPKACQVFILMKHLTFLGSMFFRHHQIKRHLKNIFFLNNQNVFSCICILNLLHCAQCFAKEVRGPALVSQTKIWFYISYSSHIAHTSKNSMQKLCILFVDCKQHLYIFLLLRYKYPSYFNQWEFL